MGQARPLRTLRHMNAQRLQAIETSQNGRDLTDEV